MTVKDKVTILVDGDIFIYQASAAAEKPIQWDEDLWTLHSSLDEATAIFTQKLESVVEEVLEYVTSCTDYDIIIALSSQDGTNFRKDIYPDYKSNRKDKRSPLVRKALYDYVLNNYNTFSRPHLEADDVLGILATSPYIVESAHKVIVSSDKDFKTIPGHHYNMDKKEQFIILPSESAYWHMYQTLTGDTADGYPGCPGVGPKKAEALLPEPMFRDTPDEYYSKAWPIVLEAYKKAKLGEEFALTMARLARICQRDDYNFKEKAVLLWQPPALLLLTQEE